MPTDYFVQLKVNYLSNYNCQIRLYKNQWKIEKTMNRPTLYMQLLKTPAAEPEFASVSIIASEKSFDSEDTDAKKFTFRQITPSLIFEWQGKLNIEKWGEKESQDRGPGIFIVKDNKTNDLIFQMQVSKWQNGVPTGRIRARRIKTYQKNETGIYKTEDEFIFEGQTNQCVKHGLGKLICNSKKSDNRIRKTEIEGEWQCDVLVKCNIIEEEGIRSMEFKQNIMWAERSQNRIPSYLGKLPNDKKFQFVGVDNKLSY